jgi:hypothetical protein
MSRLKEYAAIDRSAEETRRELARYLAAAADESGPAFVPLRVPIDGQTKRFGLPLDRAVRVRIETAYDATRPAKMLLVTWAPEGPLVFPAFEGRLSVTGDVHKSSLELSGSYDTPVGPSGQPFDSAIGTEIAQFTARELLAALKHVVEENAN